MNRDTQFSVFKNRLSTSRIPGMHFSPSPLFTSFAVANFAIAVMPLLHADRVVLYLEPPSERSVMPLTLQSRLGESHAESRNHADVIAP